MLLHALHGIHVSVDSVVFLAVRPDVLSQGSCIMVMDCSGWAAYGMGSVLLQGGVRIVAGLYSWPASCSVAPLGVQVWRPWRACPLSEVIPMSALAA